MQCVSRSTMCGTFCVLTCATYVSTSVLLRVSVMWMCQESVFIQSTFTPEEKLLLTQIHGLARKRASTRVRRLHPSPPLHVRTASVSLYTHMHTHTHSALLIFPANLTSPHRPHLHIDTSGAICETRSRCSPLPISTHLCGFACV